MIALLIVIIVALIAAVIWQRMILSAQDDLAASQMDHIKKLDSELSLTMNELEVTQNRLAAQAVQVEHYPALQTVNADYVRIVCGLKDRLKTTEQMPYGVYTHKFEHISGLVLYLIDSGACAPKNDDEREAKIKESIKAKVN